MAGHVTNPATQFEDRKTILSWVTSYNVYPHWKCVRGHCACAESRDPWVWGQKQLHFWNPRPRFAYSLYNFYWVTTTIKGRYSFTLERSHVSRFLAIWRPFCFMQIIRWKLKIRLGNRAHRIQHASVMLKSLVPHFYPKMHLDDYWRPLFRNPSSLKRSGDVFRQTAAMRTNLYSASYVNWQHRCKNVFYVFFILVTFLRF